jgi:nicotinamide-nucleotide amidase
MIAEIISIGDELLIGQTVNTNAAWMGEALNKIGIRVGRGLTIADDHDEILRALDESSSRAQLVLLTGGLGLTKDDVTKRALCAYFNTELVMNQEVLERITEIFSLRKIPLLEGNKSQAELPAACTVIPNHRGTASGMWFERNGVVFVAMPGVPFEMEHMMEVELLERFKSHFHRPHIIHRTILTAGVGESFLAEKIADWEESLHAENIALAYLPTPGMVKLRMSAYNVQDREKVIAVIEGKEKQLQVLINDYVYGYEQDTLHSVIAGMLTERKETVTVAESCTGGYIAQLLTAGAGASVYFPGSLVTYSDEQKSVLLGVAPSLIEEHGVVSAAVAEAMAQGARERMHTNWALATTGVAGPTGGTKETPVGTIWIGISGAFGVKSIRYQFGKRRDVNIHLAAQSALNELRKTILAQES